MNLDMSLPRRLLFMLGACMLGALLPSGCHINISSIEELQQLDRDFAYLNRSYRLTQDIDASETATWNHGAGFKPIGASNAPFRGRLDGRGHVIRGLTIARPNVDRVGLFAFLGTGGHIENLGFEEVDISGRGRVGVLVGESRGAIARCYASGSVQGASRVGGLAGWNRGGHITDCYAVGNITAREERAGGLAGENDGVIAYCHGATVVTGADIVGGLAGRNNGTVLGGFWDSEAFGRHTEAPEALSPPAMRDSSAFIEAGWDFSRIWHLYKDGRYPELRVFNR